MSSPQELCDSVAGHSPAPPELAHLGSLKTPTPTECSNWKREANMDGSVCDLLGSERPHSAGGHIDFHQRVPGSWNESSIATRGASDDSSISQGVQGAISGNFVFHLEESRTANGREAPNPVERYVSTPHPILGVTFDNQFLTENPSNPSVLIPRQPPSPTTILSIRASSQISNINGSNTGRSQGRAISVDCNLETPETQTRNKQHQHLQRVRTVNGDYHKASVDKRKSRAIDDTAQTDTPPAIQRMSAKVEYVGYAHPSFSPISNSNGGSSYQTATEGTPSTYGTAQSQFTTPSPFNLTETYAKDDWDNYLNSAPGGESSGFGKNVWRHDSPITSAPSQDTGGFNNRNFSMHDNIDILNRVRSPRGRKTPNLLKAPSFPRLLSNSLPYSHLPLRSPTPDSIDSTQIQLQDRREAGAIGIDSADTGARNVDANFAAESNIAIDPRALSPDGTVASSLLSRPELNAGVSPPGSCSLTRSKNVRRRKSLSTLRIGPYPGVAGVEYNNTGQVRVLPAHERPLTARPGADDEDRIEGISSGEASNESSRRHSHFQERLELDGVAMHASKDGKEIVDRSQSKRHMMSLSLRSERSGKDDDRVHVSANTDGMPFIATERDCERSREKKSGGLKGKLSGWWKKVKERWGAKKRS